MKAPSPTLRALLGLRSVRLYLGVAVVLAIATALQPLFAVLGPELALVCSLVLPVFAAPVGARVVVAVRAGRLVPSRDVALGAWLARTSAGVALVGLAVPLVVATVSSALRGFCDPWAGVLFVVLGPVVGVPLAALVGAFAATLTARPRVGTTLAILAPFGAILLGALRFVTTPAIFAYSHFVGYFPGTLYDPDIAIETPYWTLRLASLALAVLLVVALAVGLEPDASADEARPTGRLSLTALRRSPWATALLVLLAVGLAFVEAQGEALGHRSSSASIARELGGRLAGERCTVIVPRELPRTQAERLRDDCDYRVARAEEVLGVTQRARVTAFFFRSTDEKRRLMGASNTYIAKPWRNEVYLQLGGWPHPVLFHEIVHVVAGNVGRGPFRVSGRVGGLVPSAGIIEGIAVAVAWDEREELTPHQWARALVEVGHAPSIEETEGLGFLLQPASRAYTASGSFVRWILETRGAAAVRRLYRTGSYEDALGMSLHDAEAEWRTFLATVPLPPFAVPMARLRFERPAIFGQICPHAIAALEAELGEAVGSGDEGRAIARCDAILALDAGQAAIRAMRAGALARSGRVTEAEAELASLVGPPAAATPIVVRAREEVGDALWQRGDLTRARALFEANLAVPQGEDAARQVEVRLLGLDRGPAVGAALRELLAPSARQTHDGATQMAAIASLAESDESGLADYLAARQLFFRERFDLARPRLERALARGAGSPTLDREARRMDAVLHFARRDWAGATARFRALRDEALARDGAEGAVVEAEDWLARVRFEQARGR